MDCVLAGQNAEIMRFVRPARLSADKLLNKLGKHPEVPDPRYETGGKPLTNNVIGRRRLIDVGAKQQNSIGKIVPFLLHRFLDWILLLLLRQSPPYRSICVAHVFSKTTFSSGLMITKLKSNTKTTGWNKRPGASPTLTTRRNSPGTSRESIANQKDF